MTDWNKLKVVDLKAELKKRGLPQTGLKTALVSRLEAADDGDGEESEATVQDDALNVNDSATPLEAASPTKPHDSSATLSSEPHIPEPKIEPKDQIPVPANEPQTSAPVETQTQTESSQSTLPASASEQFDGHSSALPSVDPREVTEDKQKRKRRSQSPPSAAIDIARKRLRKSDEGPGSEEAVVTTKDDANWIGKHNAVDAAEINAEAIEVTSSGVVNDTGPTIIDSSKDQVAVEEVPAPQEVEGVESNVGGTASGPTEDATSRTRDSRFKDLFSSPQKAPLTERPHSRDSAVSNEEMEPERVISPAIHPATSALYIRDFMRPLNPPQLKAHLTELGTPPGQDIDPDCIVNFYLDPIRTHAFISFTNVSAASRVRSALHNRIWPDERTRKPLWVDFIPVDRVEAWIAEEQATHPSGRSQSKKWEVYYDVDEDRHVTATLQEATNVPRLPLHTRTPSASQNVPPPAASPLPMRATPRGTEGAPSGPRASTQIAGGRAATDLSTLDQLFKSTTAKPLLYWQPVSKSLANKRLDNIDEATSKEAMGKRLGGEINRYTFEDGDVLVDRGPEIFSGIRPPPGHRGPRGGGPRGRGGFGGGGGRDYDSWRGERPPPRDDRGGFRDDRRGFRDDRRY